MKLGISSWTFGWAVGRPGYPPENPLTVPDLLAKVVELDVRLLQMADNLPLDRLPAHDLDAFQRRAAELGIDIELGTRGIGADLLRTYLHLAGRFQSPILRTIVDTPDHQPDEDEIVETFSTLMPEFEAAGVCLAIENHDRLPAKVLRRIVERIGSPSVGICLDVANSFGCMEGPEVVVQTLTPVTVNLHVKDIAIRRFGHGLGFTIKGRPVGQGQLDVPWILRQVKEQGRDPNVILELWTPPEEKLADTIAKEAAWAEQSIEYLRTFVKD